MFKGAWDLQKAVHETQVPIISLVLNGAMSLTPRLLGPKLAEGAGTVSWLPLLSFT